MNNGFGLDAILSLANYLLVQKQDEADAVLEKYKTDVAAMYHGRVDDVDFKTNGAKIMSDVNQWVKNQTRGLIDSILSQVPSSDTRVILLNAIYFKDKWQHQFVKELTGKRKFYNKGLQTGNGAVTDFMMSLDDHWSYKDLQISGEQVQVLEMPYESGNRSMLIFLPEKKDGLTTMLSASNFTDAFSEALTSINDMRRPKVNVYIPKFELKTEYSLKPTLQSLGITDVFDPTKADLSGITEKEKLVVSKVTHKAYVKVDEEGTEAAALTAIQTVAVMAYFPQPPPIVFRADHPFLFLIRDRVTGLILFMGKVEEL